MRNQKEILARVEELVPSPHDPFGVMVGCLISFLHYRDAVRFLKSDVSREQWNQSRLRLSDENVRALLRSGIGNSWHFANKRMGVEANKAFMVIEAVLWLLGPSDHAWAMDMFWTPGKMAHFGKPQLVELHQKYDLGPWRTYDDGKWHNSEFDIDLDADSALRQWHSKWGKMLKGPGSNGRGEG